MIFNKSLINDLNKNEKEKMMWLDENKLNIMNKSITEVAKELGCSPSFITKTLKKVGFYGWKDFLGILMNNKVISKYKNEYGAYLKESLFPSIEMSIGNNDELNINKLANLISETDKDIYFVGEGFSYFMALDQNRRYNKIGIRTFALNAIDYHVASIREGSIIIFISGSGMSESIIRSKNFLKNKNNTMVLVTSNNRINDDDFDIIFKGTYYDTENINERELPRHSRIIILIMLDWIFTKVMSKNKNEILDKIVNSTYK